jgi:hypothetical protein
MHVLSTNASFYAPPFCSVTALRPTNKFEQRQSDGGNRGRRPLGYALPMHRSPTKLLGVYPCKERYDSLGTCRWRGGFSTACTAYHAQACVGSLELCNVYLGRQIARGLWQLRGPELLYPPPRPLKIHPRPSPITLAFRDTTYTA